MVQRKKQNTVQVSTEILGTLIGRANFSSRLGLQQFEGNRDLYEALGYPRTILYDDYLAQYTRQDIAKAIIDRPVKATWQGTLGVYEMKEKDETEFEKAWADLSEKLGLKTRFSRVDRLAGLGTYGVLLLGLNDVANKENFENPVQKGKKYKLEYVKPFSSKNASITTWETNPKDPRYGMPLIYSVMVTEAPTASSFTVKVHHSRIIHIVDDPLESEIEGAPRLEVVYNRLMDLEKIVGGDAEMYWRGARPGYSGKVDENFQMTPDMKVDLLNQINEYEHNLRRILINEGIDYKALEQQIADPIPHINAQIQMISAITNIPKRILTGSERGELASTQDQDEWSTYVKIRRDEHAEPHIVRPFVNRCIDLGILPPPKSGKYRLGWSDLFSMSEKARVEIGRNRSAALKDYLANPGTELVFPHKAFREFCMGLDEDQADQVEVQVESEFTEEERETAQHKSLEEPELPQQTTVPVKSAANPKLKRKVNI